MGLLSSNFSTTRKYSRPEDHVIHPQTLRIKPLPLNSSGPAFSTSKYLLDDVSLFKKCFPTRNAEVDIANIAVDNALSVLPLSVAYPMMKSTLGTALILVLGALRNFWAVVNPIVIELASQQSIRHQGLVCYLHCHNIFLWRT